MQTNSNVLEQKLLDNELPFLQRYKNFKWLDWFGIFCFSIFSVSMILIIYAFVSEILSKGAYGAWTTFDKFTDQSNVLIWLYMLFWLFFKNHSFLKGNKFLVANMVYIFFTFIGYNFVLLPSGGQFFNGDVYYGVQNVFLHVLSPLLFIGFGYAYMYCNKDKQPKSFIDLFWKGMLYPTIYCIYIITIPFMMTDNTGTAPYSVYGNPTNTNGNVWSWMYICLMYFVFFPFAFWLFYYSWKWINKANRK